MNTQYEVVKMTFRDLRNKVSLPQFQRSIVWNDNKKKLFITTITNGLPFGVLLLYKEDDITKYSLIDGLQRFSTLCSYEKSPKNYINFDSECSSFVDEIIEECVKRNNLSSNIKILKNEIIECISTHFTLTEDTTDIFNKIIISFAFLKENPDVYRIIFSMLESLKKKFSIDDLEIPVIVFNGEFSMLADIFENVNTNGSQLSKYDIYAARWSKYPLIVKDKEILKAVEDKYVAIQSTTQLEVSDYEQGLILETNKINLFEYCFALGKLIINTAPSLFDISLNTKDNNTKDKMAKEKVDSIGFNVIAAILLDTPKKKDDIEKYFKNVTSEQLADFKNKIIECVKLVRDLLLPYLKTPDNNYTVRYIESQITCIIATAFRIKYTVVKNSIVIKQSDFRPKDRNLLLDKFRQLLPLRYLYDILDDYWGNSGDSKIGSELANNLSNNRYVTKITKTDMNDVLDKWMKSQDSKKFVRPQRDSKILLNYIIQKKNEQYNLLSALDNKLELGYIIPKERYQKNFGSTKNVSHIGNLVYRPKSDKSKSLTIYEAEEPSLYKMKESIVDILLYPTSSELSFISDKNSFTESNYNSFLRKRRDFLVNTFLRLFF